ncbi:MAG: hypothetical protein H7259_01205 [Cytophagales bacterium]|nr:hypothetical protein [Cytophaga sp.]
MRILYSCFLVLFLLLSVQVKAQREGAIDYEKEFLGGVNFNTNGGVIGGFMFRYARLLTDSKNQFHTFNFELGIVKHPKEIRYASQQTGGSFIAYKKNNLVVLRPSYGREFVLFHKGNEDGVQLDFLISGGLSIGILTPYYIEYFNVGTQTSDYVPYDPVTTPDISKVLNSGGYMMGFGESKIVPGLHIRSGFSFEYSHFTNSVTGIEVGVLLEGFTQTMVILEAPVFSGTPAGYIKNKQFFSSVYINIYYGGRK